MAEINEDARPARQWGMIIAGGLGVAIAVAAIAIEAWRNAAHGHQQGGIVYAVGFALFALGLLVAPLMARHFGWTALALPFAVCVLMTGWAGVSFYAGDIRAAIEASQQQEATASTAVMDGRDADGEITALDTRLQRILETGTSERLREAMEAAQRRAEVEASRERGGCPAQVRRNGQMVESACRKAEREAAEFGRRLVDAEARDALKSELEEARRRRAEARTTAAATPVQGDGAAFVLAWATDGSEAAWRRHIGAVEPLALVVAQLLLAGLLTPSLALVQAGLEGAPKPAPQPAAPPQRKPVRRDWRKLRAKPVEQTMIEEVAPPAPPVDLRGQPIEARLQRFIEERLVADGGCVRYADLRAAFDAWWDAHCPGEARPGDGRLGQALNAAGIGQANTRTSRGRACSLKSPA